MKRNLLLSVIFCLVIPQLLLPSKDDERSCLACARKGDKRSCLARARDATVSGVWIGTKFVANTTWGGVKFTGRCIGTLVKYSAITGCCTLVAGSIIAVGFKGEIKGFIKKLKRRKAEENGDLIELLKTYIPE